ncbi:chemosensory pili system protein ChpA (sensor histidine kinase/response regulator) [Oryzisolibacter propanilivorax]|uniref:Chemotaxis protein CheA n=1 Tax=Oryzisolibacter propanilivorax TaxID=1527607 RepID=A0A1G9UZ45_9BURK|nr:Hpt domain-containing protein [Oryzisolibacter propanilivorax]SDM65056.1 chemosensory pili system protein ChpA (sensor histidine kinase/response regulator) [Oryzisolibacter propanilivorax]
MPITDTSPAGHDWTQGEQDLGPLAWVLDELRKSLDGAARAMRRFVRDAEVARQSDLAALDAGGLRVARQQLHQAGGALEMVGMAQPALVVRALESAVQRFVQRPELCGDDATGVIESASFALIEYLEHVLAGKAVSPVSLFPQYRQAQALAGADQVHPADLWPAERRLREPMLQATAEPLAYGAAARTRMDSAVLRIVKSADRQAAAELQAVALGFAALQTDRQVRIFWKVCAGFFEAMAHGALAPDVYVKRVASRVLLQYAALARTDAPLNERLLQDLLFFCAQARPTDPAALPALAAVRQAYGLERHQPVDYEKPRFGLYDPALLAQARKRIAAATETWSALAGGERNKLKPAADQFSLVCDSLRRLQPGSESLARALTEASDAVVRSGEPPNPSLAIEVATAVLYLQASFDDLDLAQDQVAQRAGRLAQRVAEVAAGGEPQPLESWMEDLYRRVSDQQTMGSVVGELRIALAEAEKALDQHFRDPQDMAVLASVPGGLQQMRGVLSVLGLDQASLAVMHMRGTVEQLMTGAVAPQDRAEVFARLGNSLGALGFLVDMLSYQRAMARKLFVYDEEAQELRILMGRQRTRAGDSAAQAVAGVQARDVTATPAPAPETFVAQLAPAPAAPGTDTLQPLMAPAADHLPVAAPPAPPIDPAAAVPAAAGPAPAPAISQPQPGDADEDDGGELQDIFLEEAREVVATGLQASAALRQQPGDLSEQTTLRRAFHTLKGSSRMVGLTEFGEAAWALEQALNAWLAEQKPMPEPLLALSEHALHSFGRWSDDIASGNAQAWQAQPFRAAADAVRQGGTLPDLTLAPTDHALPEPAAAIQATEEHLLLQEMPEPVAMPLDMEQEQPAPTAAQKPVAAPDEAAPALAELPWEPHPELDLLDDGLAHEPGLPLGFDLELPPALAAAPEADEAPLDFADTFIDGALMPEAADAPAALLPEGEEIDFSLFEQAMEGELDPPLALSLPPRDAAAGSEAAEPPEVMTELPLEWGAGDTEALLPPSVPDDTLMVPLDEALPRLPVAPDDQASDVQDFSLDLELPERHDVAPAPQPPAVALPPEADVPAAELVSVPGADAGVESQGAGLDWPLADDASQQAWADEPAAEEVRTEPPLAGQMPAEFAGEPHEPLPQSEREPEDEKPAMAEAVPAAAPESWPEQETLAQSQPESAHAPEPEPEPEPEFSTSAESSDEEVKVIGDLRIGIPLYNVYLNEADEWSRRLSTALQEWELELHQPVPEVAIALAHSLAGSSATVGFADLSGLARTLEHVLQHLQLLPQGLPEHARRVNAAAHDIRRLLHQFAAGFIKEPNPQVLAQLQQLLDVEVTSARAPLDFSAVRQAMPEREGAGLAHVAPMPVPQPAAAAAASALVDDDDIDALDTIDPDLFPIFEEEAAELLPRLGGALRQWSVRPDNLSARSELLRALHTLKGSARLAGAMRLGEMAHRLESAVERIPVESTQSSDVEPLLARLDVLQADFEALRTLGAQPLNEPLTVAPAAGRVEDAAAATAPAALARQPAAAPAPRAGGQSVRVRTQLLDRLVNQAGEVMIARSRLEAHMGQLRGSLDDLTGNLERLRQQLRDIEVQAESQMQSRLALSRDSAAGFDPLEFDRFTRVQELTRMMAESVNDVATVQRNMQRAMEGAEDDLIAQGRQARELQRDLLRTRMVEFEGLSERLYAVVRQAAKETGKQVKLDIVGGAIEMDRGVLDRMAPVFEHLLRNCIGHGIEPPEQRQAAGKPAVGSITISLRQEGNDVSVEFRDDGAGLDVQRIRDKAVALGLLPAGVQLGRADAAQLIFQPGFTTASEVTGLSGRGIGMDVVRTEVSALGGRIETESADGQGTAFRLVLPLTTAVTQVVMLRAGQLVFGVPASLIEIVRRVPAAALDAAYADGAFEHDGETLALHWAGALLQSSARSDETAGRTRPVVIVRSAAQRLAMHVDEVLGNQEVVVKNLGPQLSRLPGLAGMSVLASGAVVLIYNPVALATVYGEQLRAGRSAALPAHGQEQAGAPPAAALPQDAAAAAQVPLVLVVDDSITVRRVTQRLLKREGYRVALAADGLQALERLQEERPAVVLSDIEMPRMDGFDLARNIRADAALAGLPIIMITSRIAQKHREHALELGVNHYLGKPYSDDELLGLVQRYAHQAATADSA